MKTLGAVCKLTAFVLLCCFVVPLQTLVLLLHRGRYAYVLPHLWHRGVCAIFRIKPVVIGKPLTDRQVFFVGNHLSYLDIELIATQLCFASFVAKQDVAGWPVFGYLSKLQQTVFISRARTNATQASGSLESALAAGKSLIVFPEGTSTDGLTVMPFKSSLFALLVNETYRDLSIQPFTIDILRIDGKPANTKAERHIYAWPFDDDIGLAAHLWRFARISGAEIALIFHTPIRAGEYSDRKALAKACQDAVSNGLAISKTL
jgi:1-acyl-sn-glycerol-3-phosphate acyltransferase